MPNPIKLPAAANTKFSEVVYDMVHCGYSQLVLRLSILCWCLFSAKAIIAEIDVKTSLSDTRRFDSFTLENQLKVFLISDPDAHKAAVALDIHVGSGEDPKHRQGLAHFLEHMLFLGTQSYPKPGEFQDFISGHGGSHNAHTSLMHTNYYFDIDPEYLKPAAERFASFFYQPLFLADYVEREQLAVHSEYASKLSVASRRDRDVISRLLREDHPLAKFYTGSKDTLGKDGLDALREDLLAFYARYYSANRMAVAISGPQTLKQLKKIALENFSAISNKALVIEDYGPDLFPENFLPAEVHIKAQKERRKLSLLFPVPSEKKFEDKKPLRYIGNFIGHEGKGSLLSALRTHNLATGLSAGSVFRWRGGEAFSVDIALTEKGHARQSLVYQLVFSYLDLLRKEGIEKWRYEELSQLDEMRFRYAEKGSARREVSRIAALLHERDAADIYWRRYNWQSFDKALIDKYMRYLTKDNALTVLVSPEIEGDKTSPYYNAPYTIIDDDASLKRAEVNQSRLDNISRSLGLPKKNPFIANDFSIINEKNASANLPRIVFTRAQSEGWFLNDDLSQIPKVFIRTRVWLPFVAQSANNFVLTRLYTRIIEDALSEIAYDAALAGLSYNIHPSTRGIDIDFYGYNQGVEKLLKRVVKELRKFKRSKRHRKMLSDSYFDQAKKDFQRALQNRKFAKLYSQAVQEIPELIYAPYWSDEEITQALSDIDQQKFEQSITQLMKNAQFESLVYGNFSAKQAGKYFRRMATLIKPAQQSELPAERVVNFHANDRRFIKPFVSANNEHILALYVQAENTSMKMRAATMLLEQMVSTAFYRVLRTEKQLGYIVFTSNYRLREVPGILSLVQSPSHSSAELYHEMLNFFATHKEEALANFARDKKALLSKLEDPPKNQSQWLDLFWEGILNNDTNFDEKARLIAALKSIEPAFINRLYDLLFEEAVFHLAVASVQAEGEETTRIHRRAAAAADKKELAQSSGTESSGLAKRFSKLEHNLGKKLPPPEVINSLPASLPVYVLE